MPTKRLRTVSVCAWFVVALVALASVNSVLATESSASTIASKAADLSSQKASTRQLLELEDNNEDYMHEIRNSVVIGILTTESQHSRIKMLQETWWRSGLENVVEVYSNVSVDPRVPSLVDAKAGPEDAAALWHRVHFMAKIWSLPQYRNVKWFVIAHDASYLNLENMWGYLATQNHSKPMLIGDVHCTTEGVQYVNGKGAIILSRAVIDTIDWYVFSWPLRSPYRRGDYQYDQFLGQYAMRRAIPVVAHRGMLASHYGPQSELYKHFAQYSATGADKSLSGAWPYPIRPISSDQTEGFNFMPTLHGAISSLAKTSNNPIRESSTTCKCKYRAESKCTFGWDQKDACFQTAARMSCFSGPNPVSLS